MLKPREPSPSALLMTAETLLQQSEALQSQAFSFGNTWRVAPRFLAEGPRGRRRGPRCRGSGRPRAYGASGRLQRAIPRLLDPDDDVDSDHGGLAARLP